MARAQIRMSDRAYEILRDRIIRIELAPLTALSEKELQVELGIGIQPLREAIRRLEQDHLVTIFPRRGTFVSEIAVRDEHRVTEVRVDLEGLCAELAAARGSTEEKEKLVALAQEHVVRHGNSTVDADERFHRAMYTMTGNRFLEKSLSQYYNLSLRAWYFFVTKEPLPDEDVEPDHLRTAIAIRDGNGALARELASEHVRRSSRKLMELLDTQRFVLPR